MNKQDFEILEDILVKVNDWLKFAESKNAVLIALTGAGIFAFLSYANTIKLIEFEIGKFYFYNFLFFSVVGLALSLTSFLPQTKLFWLWKEKSLHRNPNLFFFGDLARLDPQSLVCCIYKEDKSRDSALNRIMTNLAEQIITNSKIVRRKYNYFRVALWCILSATLTPLVSITLYILFDPHGKDSVE